MEVSKKDWKLYREKIQPASTKFWELEKKIKRDRKNPGVLIELSKQNMPFDLIRLIHEGVITVDYLEGFSDELKETVNYLI